MPSQLFATRTRPHRWGILARIAAVCGCVLVISSCQSGAEDRELTVFAASSTRVMNEAFIEAGQGLEPAYDIQVSNAGSSALVEQLVAGAPADLLLTASAETMERAQAAGVVQEPVVLANNYLVMVVPADNPAGINSIDDLDGSARLALCDPQVPCGDLAQRLIANHGWTITADSYEPQVADALSRVVSGQADAAWVYSTDVLAAGDAVRVVDIPGGRNFPNQILGAVAADSPHPEPAQELLSAMSQRLQPQWKRAGFSPTSNDS